MCDLDVLVVYGQQPGFGQTGDGAVHEIRLGVLLDVGARDDPASVGGVLTRRHQAQEKASRRGALGVVETLLESRLGRLADRPGNAAGGMKTVQGQNVAAPAQPGFDQRVRHQRQ